MQQFSAFMQLLEVPRSYSFDFIYLNPNKINNSVLLMQLRYQHCAGCLRAYFFLIFRAWLGPFET